MPRCVSSTPPTLSAPAAARCERHHNPNAFQKSVVEHRHRAETAASALASNTARGDEQADVAAIAVPEDDRARLVEPDKLLLSRWLDDRGGGAASRRRSDDRA